MAALLGSICWYVEHLKAEIKIGQSELATVQQNYDKAQGVISENKQAIADLTALRLIDAKTLSDMSDSFMKLNAQSNTRVIERTTLEKTNVAVKNFLDQPVPDDLRRLLDRQNAGYLGANANPEGLPTGATGQGTGTAPAPASPSH